MPECFTLWNLSGKVDLMEPIGTKPFDFSSVNGK